jgi:hypothetical protein
VSNPYFHAMIADMDQVVSSLLGKPSLRDMPASELKHLTLQYPYASFLHLLRSRKLKDTNDPEYPSSVALTALYFSNPHWLHHQLQATTAGMRVHEWEKAMVTENDVQDRVLETPPPEPEMPQEVSTVPELVDAPGPEITADGPDDTDAVSNEEKVEEGPAMGKLSDILKAPVSPGASLEIPIEPLYTIDYFASLGIRVPSEPGTGDALGHKLKSFTEWLKAMRKIHPEKVDAQMDPGSETRIRQEADHSNDPSGVITETMAEVLKRQGLRENAIELYRKLSLLEPAKSVYFAAKIEELKDPKS